MPNINAAGKLEFKRLDVAIIGACNLRCKNCCSFSPAVDYRVPTATVLESIPILAARFKPKMVSILGGEPLLHEGIIDILNCACEHFSEGSDVLLRTNGELLVKGYARLQDLIDLSARYKNFAIIISKHIIETPLIKWTEEHKDRLKIGLKYVRDTFHTIDIGVLGQDKELVFNTRDKNIVMQHSVQTENANPVCNMYVRENYSVTGSKLFRCACHGFRCNLVKYGLSNKQIINKEWAEAVLASDGIDFYTAPMEDILKYVTDAPFDECALCTPAQSYEQKQMTPEEYESYLRAFS